MRSCCVLTAATSQHQCKGLLQPLEPATETQARTEHSVEGLFGQTVKLMTQQRLGQGASQRSVHIHFLPGLPHTIGNAQTASALKQRFTLFSPTATEGSILGQGLAVLLRLAGKAFLLQPSVQFWSCKYCMLTGCAAVELRPLPGCSSCTLSQLPPSQHTLAVTHWQAQLRGVRALESARWIPISPSAAERSSYFPAAPMQGCFLHALEVLLVEELRGLSFGSGMDTAWGWEV